MVSLQEAVRLISSDKAKERSEGLEHYKDIFQDVRTLQNITESNDDGARWLRTMQALFTCFQSDKFACLKRGLADAAPITLRRLKESAQMVQWTVEKAYTYYPQSVFVAVFNHLTQSLDDRGRLFEPLAIDYLKALHTLLAYQPHMDHLDTNSWKYATACCFNILLDDIMSRELDDCSLSDLFSEEETMREASQRPSRLLDAEVTSCLQILVSAPNAPLVGSSRLGAHVLQRYASFLVGYPSDSTAHLPALQGLNHVLSELELNESEFLRRFAEQAWPSLLGLWSTKSRQLKEQILISLHTLLPFLSCKTEYTTEIASLHRKLLDEPDQRFALQPLSLTSIEFCSSLRQDAFQYSSLRTGSNFSFGDAQTWATLELAADCTMVLFHSGTKTALSESEVESRPSKRQRQDNGAQGKQTIDAVDDLLERASRAPKGHGGKASQLWNLQILLFLTLRYAQQKGPSDEWIEKVLHSLVELLGHNDMEVQSWSLLILATLAPNPISHPACKHIWPTVCRRVMQSGTSRAASHTAQAILLSGCVQSREILAELHTIFEDLEMQGPSHAYDSVCSFLKEAIVVTSKDISTVNWKAEEKTLAWLQSVWSKSDFTSRGKASAETGDPTAVASLLSAICNFSSFSTWSRSELHLPATPIVNRLLQETQSHHIRSFILNPEIPEEKSQETTGQTNADQAVQTTRRGPRGIEVRCLNFIQKGLKTHLHLIKSSSFVSTANLEQIKMAVDFAVLSLLFNGSLQIDHVSSQTHLIELAHQLLEFAIQAVVHPKWSITDTAIILVTLHPLLGGDKIFASQVDKILQAPGEQSGIETEVLLSQNLKESHVGKKEVLDDQMSLIWESPKGPALVECFKKLYDKLSSNLSSQEATDYAQQDDDELWAGVTSRTAKQGSITQSDRGPDHSFVALLTVSAMTIISKWNKSESNGVTRLKEFVLSNKDAVSNLLLSGANIFRKVLIGELAFTNEELEQILETIGNDLLSDYKYEQNLEAQLLALEFLHGTIKQWSVSDTPLFGDAIKLTSYFVKQLNKGKLSWKVEKRILPFLERFLELALDGNGQLREVKPPILALDAIVKSLISLNGRPDIRIRWPCLTMTARMYQVWVQLDMEPLQLYEHTEKTATKDTSSDEQMATRIITFGNALVACSQVRHVALYHLIELTLVEDTFNSYTEKILRLASKLLGFPSPPSLWLLFATQTTWAIIKNDYQIDRIPFQVIGFKSKKEMLEQSFKPVASMLVALSEKIDSREFQTLATMGGKTLNEALFECIPFLAASELGFLASTEDKGQAFDTMSNQMETRLRQIGNQSHSIIEKAISQSLDVVVAGILKLFYEPDFDTYKDFLYKQNPTCAAALERIEGLQDATCHEPCKPFNGGSAVYQSIMILASRMKKTLDEATIYSVIHQVITLIYQERLVNDQRRHIYGLKLFICIARKSIEQSSAIIRLLAHSCAVLMGIVDLVDSIWPLFDWTFDLVKSSIPGVSSSLILLSRHARRFNRSKCSFVEEAGIRLSERLGRLLVRLKESKQKAIALEAICAWPTEYPATLTTREYDIAITKYTSALYLTSSISATFLQRISRALTRADDGEMTEFCSSTIWTILDRLREEKLDEEEQGQVAASIADLLYQCNGRISSPSSATTQNVLTHRKGILTAINRIDPSGIQPLQPLKSWLTRQLVELTRSTELESAQAAVSCLRSIFTNEPQFAGSTRDDWEPLDVEDLRLITSFTIPALAPLKKRRREELEAEEGLLKGVKYDDWIVWICELLCGLMAEKVDCTSFAQLSGLVSKDVKFSKRTFAVLLHISLSSDLSLKEDKRLDTTSISFHLISILQRNQTDKEVWKTVIQVIVQLRHDSPSETPLEHDRWIKDVDYFLLERRATQCQLYATAVLFAELEHEHQTEKKQRGDEEAEVRLSLQYEIYSNIDDPDSFYGITNPDVRDSLINRLQHEGQWDRLFDFYAAQQEGSNQALTGIAKSLHHQGFNRLSLQLDERQTISYGAAWRMGKWDLPVEKMEAGTSQSLFSALRAVHNDQDANAAKSVVDRAFRCEYSGLVRANIEANRAVRNSVKDLLGLREVNHFQGKDQTLRRPSERFEFDDIEQIMSVRLSLLRADRRRHESKQIGDLPGKEVINLAQTECATLLALSQEARRNQKLQIAVNFVTQAQQLSKDLDKVPVEEEFASLLWDLGDHATAIDSLTRIVKASQEKIAKVRGKDRSAGLLPLSLARLGQWKATARSHQPRAIEEDCFAPATQLVNISSLQAEEKASVFYDFATFAHEQYQALLRSPEGDNLTAFIRYRKEEVDQLELQMKRPPVTSKVVRAKEKAEKLLQMDQEKLNDYEKSKNDFRKQAVYLYSALLPMTDTFDDRTVIRLISLWFGNSDDEKLNKEFSAWLQEIPSRKFLPFVHQLSSRLSINNNSTASLPSTQSGPTKSFHTNVRETISRMCHDHPFHALTPLYALSRADDDKEGRAQASRKGGAVLLSKTTKTPQGSVPISQLLRKEAVSHIMNKVAADYRLPDRIKEWKKVCDACVQWARFDLIVQMPTMFGPDASDSTTKIHVISPSFNLSITRLRSVDVPVLTRPLPVDETLLYEDIVSISKYNDRFTTAGGVHLPKIIDCVGSDGISYRQLFKNLDDLRQDAVMQQVFGILNNLLTSDREAQKRQLRVRTYAVIPLGPRYGLLEFVGNTRPLHSPLMATHKNYRKKGDITPQEARIRISSFEFRGKSRKEQSNFYQEVCNLLPPTFRFHFLERHKIPIALLTSRLNYTRSVATTSIVGHILGLGDRHVSNILLDDSTGEVIHIDFGVAFDQGKLLPIPELVPFRLTRDMVDAMGLHGVEGVFRRCCQETLRVLRDGASVIETVLQVFRYDPLYDWTQNPVKVIRAQAHASQEQPSSAGGGGTLDHAHRRVSHQLQNMLEGKDVAELLAERAIGTVMEKLSTSLSVEYTVNDLMLQARDYANLGSIFSGWQAAL